MAVIIKSHCEQFNELKKVRGTLWSKKKLKVQENLQKLLKITSTQEVPLYLFRWF